VSLVVDCAESELPIEADNDLLRRLVENLLDNALRYTSSGGRVTVSASRHNGELRLAVADQGPGIPVDQREHIFEKYAQLDRVTDQAQKRFGRGIGLAFVKLAVESHGGRIWVEDNKPVGACFELRFPAQRAALSVDADTL
jgi:signal transduction histidine kinase